MKKSFGFFWFVLFLGLTPLHAAEKMVEPVSLPSFETPSSRVENLIITADRALEVTPGQVFTTGTEEPGTLLPYLISTPKPIAYPRGAVQKGWEGDFSIAVEVKLDGTVGRWQVMHSTEHELLDQAAVASVLTWKFHPAVKDGKPFVTCIEIPVTFELRRDEA